MSPTVASVACSIPLALAPGAWVPAFVVILISALILFVGLHLLTMLRGAPRPRWGQRITKQGVVFSLVTLAVAIVALHTKINFLVLIFGMMLSAVLLSFVLSRTTMRRVSFARRVPDGVYPDQPFTIELQTRNRKRWMSSYGLVVRDGLPDGLMAERPGGMVVQLGPGHTATLTYTATALRRGVCRMSSASFSTRFPFGLFHQERLRALPSELVVYPRLGTVAPNFLGRAQSLAHTRRQSRAARGEEEFRGLREYRHGDNPRYIHWKTSAKLGQLLIKEHEAVVTDRAFILLDTRCRASGEEPLESAVSFVATLARDLMLRDFHVSLAAYAPELTVTAAVKGLAGLHALLHVLARLEPAERRTLGELVAEPRVRAEERVLTVAVLLHTDADAAIALEQLQIRQPRVVAIDASAPSFADAFQPHA